MNTFSQHEMRRTFVTLLGSTARTWQGLGYAIGFMVVFAWLPDGLSGIAKDGLHADRLSLIQVSVSVVFIGWTVFQVRKLTNRIKPTIDIDRAPAKAKGLILFLSDNRDSKLYAEETIQTISDLGTNSFRMPLSAIAYHQERLEQVVVFCSESSQKVFEDFCASVRKLITKSEKITLQKVSTLMNYEDADMLYDNLAEQFEYLKKEHNFKDKDIVIDVTGGTKVVVIAGILFGLPHNREVQYVSTSNYTVTTYDITYHEEEVS